MNDKILLGVGLLAVVLIGCVIAFAGYAYTAAAH